MADKKLYFDKELSFTLWLKSKRHNTNHNTNHYFTFPQYHLSGERQSQLYTLSDELCYYATNKLVLCIEYHDFKDKWTHIGFVLAEDQHGVLTTKCYINGKFAQVETTNHRLGKPPTESFNGFVLGNDVDGDEINNPNQFADAQMAELYMYNRALTDDEIVSAYRHKTPVEDRIISWEEFSTTLDGKTEVHIKPYRMELTVN